jgi:hypothetical protein
MLMLMMMMMMMMMVILMKKLLMLMEFSPQRQNLQTLYFIHSQTFPYLTLKTTHLSRHMQHPYEYTPCISTAIVPSNANAWAGSISSFSIYTIVLSIDKAGNHASI